MRTYEEVWERKIADEREHCDTRISNALPYRPGDSLVINGNLPAAVEPAQAPSHAFLHTSHPFLLNARRNLLTSLRRFRHHVNELMSSVGQDQESFRKLEGKSKESV